MRSRKSLIEKTHGPPVKMLAYCDGCNSVKIRYKDEKEFWQTSIVVFENIPKEKCYSCSKKTRSH